MAAALSRVVRPTVNLASRGAFAGRAMPSPVRAKYFTRSVAAAASASANPVAVFDTSMGSFEVSESHGGEGEGAAIYIDDLYRAKVDPSSLLSRARPSG